MFAQNRQKRSHCSSLVQCRHTTLSYPGMIVESNKLSTYVSFTFEDPLSWKSLKRLFSENGLNKPGQLPAWDTRRGEEFSGRGPNCFDLYRRGAKNFWGALPPLVTRLEEALQVPRQWLLLSIPPPFEKQTETHQNGVEVRFKFQLLF